MTEDEDWSIECSDEEFRDCKGEWEPPVEILQEYYDQLEKGQNPELEWKCPGYRAPSPVAEKISNEKTEVKHEEDKSDFDFMDETTSPKLKIRNKGEEVLKGSAKKKTTSLDGVINNMRRHNLLPHGSNSSN